MDRGGGGIADVGHHPAHHIDPKQEYAEQLRQHMAETQYHNQQRDGRYGSNATAAPHNATGLIGFGHDHERERQLQHQVLAAERSRRASQQLEYNLHTSPQSHEMQGGYSHVNKHSSSGYSHAPVLGRSMDLPYGPGLTATMVGGGTIPTTATDMFHHSETHEAEARRLQQGAYRRDLEAQIA
ncbi:unnamed protein product, partial [Chrysoparadoxa australica]